MFTGSSCGCWRSSSFHHRSNQGNSWKHRDHHTFWLWFQKMVSWSHFSKLARCIWLIWLC